MGIQKQQRYCPTEDKMVLAERQTPNHVLHLLLSILTAGVWVIVWLFLAFKSGLHTYRCPSCGGPTRSAWFNRPKRQR